jgi:hypothetical protein
LTTLLGPRRSECTASLAPTENPADERRAYSDGLGELHVSCPECARHEFPPDAPASAASRHAPDPDASSPGSSASPIRARRAGRGCPGADARRDESSALALYVLDHFTEMFRQFR